MTFAQFWYKLCTKLHYRPLRYHYVSWLEASIDELEATVAKLETKLDELEEEKIDGGK